MADPTSEEGSYRQILRSSSVVGGASVAQIVLGLIRMKAAALLTGLAGVGLIGLFTNFMTTASTVGGLGVANAATRQIAAERSRAGEQGEATARRALASATLGLAVGTAALVWLLREPVSRFVLGNTGYGGAVGWLAIGAGLAILASSQTAVLAGLRQMGALARTIVVGGVIATIAGLVALSLFGSKALIFFVIALPLANVIAGAWFVARLPRPVSGKIGVRQLSAQWGQLASLGTAFMLSQLLANAAQLAARVLIQQRLGLAELGLFQAAWAVSMTYLSVVLQAMAADYYPRLSEAIERPDAAARIVSEQTEVALLLGTPIILATLALAPLGLEILYSSGFRDGAELLRWQILGDVLKIASWPTAFVLLAANRGRTFLFAEAMGWTAFLTTTWLLMPVLGLEAAGIGYFVMYLVYLPVVLIAGRRTIGPTWSATALKDLLIVSAAAAAVFASAWHSALMGMVVGLPAAVLFAVIAAAKLRQRFRQRKPA